MAKKADKKKAAVADQPEIDEVEASRAPLMDHLIELRNRLMRILILLVVLFCGLWFVADTVLSFLLTPLGDAAHRAGRPLNELFVAQTTAPLEMLFVKLKLAFVMALAIGFRTSPIRSTRSWRPGSTRTSGLPCCRSCS